MKFEVRNRWSRDVQFTAEINATDKMSQNTKLGLAVKWAVKNGASLRGANLRGANLYGIDLSYTDLRGTDLRGANLRYANLCGANLRTADFGESYWVIQGPTRSDGQHFMLAKLKDGGVRVLAGCRNLSVKDAITHWKKYPWQLGEESLAIVAHLVKLQKIRGLK